MGKEISILTSRRLSRLASGFENELFRLEISWCRVASATNENLLAAPAWHSFYEFHYIKEGSLTFRIGEEEVLMKAGEMLLIPPRMIHETISVCGDVVKFVFGFTVEFTDREKQERFLSVTADRYILQKIDGMIPLMDSFANLGTWEEKYAMIGVADIAELVVLNLFRNLSLEKENSLAIKNVFESDMRINTVMSYIREHIEEGVFKEDLMNELHLSERQLNRVVQAQTGLTVKQLIDREKLLYIKRLLCSELSLNVIASMTGFSSEYTLNRFFKRNEGLSPGVWRKSIEK